MVCQLGPRHCPGPKNEQANKVLDLRPGPSCVPVLPPPGSGQPPLWSHTSLQLRLCQAPCHAAPSPLCYTRTVCRAKVLPPHTSPPVCAPTLDSDHWTVCPPLPLDPAPAPYRLSSQLAVTSTERHNQIASQPQTLLSLPLARRGVGPKPARPRPGSCPQTSLLSSKRSICLPACL